MSIELKPCHCGSDGPFLGVQHKEGFLSLVCPKCSRSVESFTPEGLAEGWNDPTGSTSSQSKAEIEENPASPPTVDQVMEQAQVFASAWSLVSGPFDSGDQLEQAKREKEELLGMVEALAGEQAQLAAVIWKKPDDRPVQIESRIVLNDLLLQAASMLSNPSASMTARQQLTRSIEGELENNPLLQVEREEVSHG
ncbi:hypothetical protein ACFOJE_01545 [Azotobacter bryophylli]|uniref:Uncharacterized protein n=1 Tax=Azotobacter bryophylli TaxID=1986537 RepID=A0ABV7ANN5_9GAMM